MMEWQYISDILENNSLEENVIAKKDIFLFGAGTHGRLSVSYLKDNFNLKAICDNNAESFYKKGITEINEIKIISVEDISKISKNAFVLISVIKDYENIARQLEELGLEYGNLFTLIYKENIDKLENVCKMCLTDDNSRHIFNTLIYCKIINNRKLLKDIFDCNNYFSLPEFNDMDAGNVFVDCGAYVGDGVEEYVKRNIAIFNKIYAFEPSELQFQAMFNRVKRIANEYAIPEEKIILEKKATGKSNGIYYLNSSNQSNGIGDFVSSSSASGMNTEVVSLDEYFSVNKERITLIKADIEGEELNMLEGAKQIILSQKPLLAISIYHAPIDFFTIPLYIKSLVPEYNMAIRHHSTNFFDTVLYCYLD